MRRIARANVLLWLLAGAGTAEEARHIGSKTCAGCHAQSYASFRRPGL